MATETTIPPLLLLIQLLLRLPSSQYKLSLLQPRRPLPSLPTLPLSLLPLPLPLLLLLLLLRLMATTIAADDDNAANAVLSQTTASPASHKSRRCRRVGCACRRAAKFTPAAEQRGRCSTLDGVGNCDANVMIIRGHLQASTTLSPPPSMPSNPSHRTPRRTPAERHRISSASDCVEGEAP